LDSHVALDTRVPSPTSSARSTIGKQPGSTTVVLDFENPFYGDRERRTIPVTVTPAPSRTAIALGSPPPDEGGERSDVRVYVCSSYVTVEN
jgi:hypothetical protein